MSKCELLLTNEEAKARGILDGIVWVEEEIEAGLPEADGFECGNPATVHVKFKYSKAQMICEQCHSECADLLGDE